MATFEPDKEKVNKMFRDITKHSTLESPGQLYADLGTAIGLIALGLERVASVDRAATFKMLQRYGHAAIKEMERDKN